MRLPPYPAQIHSFLKNMQSLDIRGRKRCCNSSLKTAAVGREEADRAEL